MANYVLAFHGGGGVPQTEAEQAAVMEAWGAWFASMGDAVVDMGAPVGRASTVASDGAVSPGGGTNPLTGYTVIAADDLDGAVALAKGCPILGSGGSIEVAETVDM